MGSRLTNAFLFGSFAVVALLAACSAPDPGALNVQDPIVPNGRNTSTSTSSGTAASSTSSGAPAGLFADAFKTGDPGQDTSAATVHTGAVAGNKFGQDCSKAGCHAATGGGAGAPVWKAAGSVYDGTAPAVNVQVRIKGDKGLCDTFTDKSGNFWCETDMGTLQSAGVRNATKTSLMMSTPPSGGCQATPTCHSATVNKMGF